MSPRIQHGTVDQHDMTPTAKVTAATAGGAAGILVVFIAGQFGLQVSPEVASAITTLLALAAGYFKRESAPVRPGERGYSVVEVLAALFIAVLVVLVFLAVIHRV